MKKLLGFIFCMTVIPALILACAAGFIYNNYFKPTPMEYGFLRGESEICSVEYAIVSFDSEGNLHTQRVGFVTDVDGFVADIKALDCYAGIPLDSFRNLRDIKTLSGFVINYTDGSFEVITPYVCLNSDLEITEIKDLLEADVYCFDKTAIQDMLIKYSPSDLTET